MKREEFLMELKKRIVLLDGATGTELQKRGMPQGVCPEAWISEHPEMLIEIQRGYVEAGSDIVYAPTFGANRWKLEEFGLQDQVIALNKRLAALSKEAVDGRGWVAGNLSPTGQFIKPFGDKAFEDAVDVYKEQVRALLEGGVDLFVIETMIDIQEARAALLAVKETCDLPVLVTLTFNEDQRTLTGTDPVSAVVTLQSMGADAVGCNCSTGPQDMLTVIEQMKKVSHVPLMVKPNAGLPVYEEGRLHYNMDASQFAEFAEPFAELGVNLIGGCCGTTPEYIKLLKEKTNGILPRIWNKKSHSVISSARKTVYMGTEYPLTIVGERINPTGKKKLQAELKEGSLEGIRRFAQEQQEQGARILDVNVGMPGIDEKAVMIKVIEALSAFTPLPLSIDSSDPAVIEAALRIYPGRALINSISGESHKVERLLPIASKYGAMFILLPLNDREVPKNAAGRIKIIQEVLEHAKKYEYEPLDIVVDGLVMTVSADQQAARETLDVIEWCDRKLGCNTIVGLSNVSFGLPERTWLNAAFLTIAMGRGLSMAIANPGSDSLVACKMAADVLMGRDIHSHQYIERFAGAATKIQPSAIVEAKTPLENIYDCVLKGGKEKIDGWIREALAQEIPFAIVNQALIPAIQQVGELFDRKEYFLPQLILSAETMKTGFEILEPMLQEEQNGERAKKIKVIAATVKGDIHDIGKNIVVLMLKNYGFEVIDLGKDVSKERIVQKAKEAEANIIALSALMTTTMGEMREVIQLAKKEGLQVYFMIGGAVVTREYAEEIGADGYAEDAISAVRLAEQLVKRDKTAYSIPRVLPS